MDEDEHKEIDRTHNLNSARTFFYQGEAECDANMKVFIHCIDAVKGKNWEAFKKQVQKLDIDASWNIFRSKLWDIVIFYVVILIHDKYTCIFNIKNFPYFNAYICILHVQFKFALC